MDSQRKIMFDGMFQNDFALRAIIGGFEAHWEAEASKGTGGLEKRDGAAEVSLYLGHNDGIGSGGSGR
jgi:hypothetical protein